MYSLIMVENDQLARHGLISMVRWKDLGFQVKGEFSDGQEALDYIKTHTPDAVLSEVTVPGISGLDLARYIMEHDLPTKIIFVTANSDITAAQLATEYHAAHYLIKPVPFPKLRAIFANLKEELDQEYAQKLAQEKQDRHYRSLVRYEKQKFVIDAYYGALSHPPKMQKRLRLLDIEKPEEYHAKLYLMRLIICKDEEYSSFILKYGIQELQDQILRVLQSYDRNYDFYSISWNDLDEIGVQRLLGIFWQKDECTDGDGGIIDQAEFIEGISEMTYSLTSIECGVTGLYPLQTLTDLSHCAEIIGQKEAAEKPLPDVDFLQMLREQKKNLYQCICQNDPGQVMEYAHSFLNNCMRSGLTFAHRQCCHALTLLIDRIADNDLKAWNKLYMQCMTPYLFTEPQQEELERWFSSQLMKLHQFANDQAKMKTDSSYDKVMHYIHQNYCQDITLTDVAEKVYLNSAYISRMIKEQTGMNYTDLIMELRINRAIELLEHTDQYVYEVAEAVGYHNLKYFYKVFKKVKGRSPNDYRKSVKEELES